MVKSMKFVKKGSGFCKKTCRKWHHSCKAAMMPAPNEASGGSSYMVMNQFGIMETYDRLILEGEIEFTA